MEALEAEMDMDATISLGAPPGWAWAKSWVLARRPGLMDWRIQGLPSPPRNKVGRSCRDRTQTRNDFRRHIFLSVTGFWLDGPIAVHAASLTRRDHFEPPRCEPVVTQYLGLSLDQPFSQSSPVSIALGDLFHPTGVF